MDLRWLLVTLTACATIVAAARLGAVEYEDADLELTMPAFPPAPKRDRKMLHMDAASTESEASWKEVSEADFKASSHPRFQNEEGEITLEADELEAGEFRFGGNVQMGRDGQQNLVYVSAQPPADTTSPVHSPPARYFTPQYYGSGADPAMRMMGVQPVGEDKPLPPPPVYHHPHPQVAQMAAMRFAEHRAAIGQRAVAALGKPAKGPAKVAMATPTLQPAAAVFNGPYNTAGMLPPQPAALRAAAQQQFQVGDDLFTPIPPMQRRFPVQTDPKLADNPNLYAFANAAQSATYRYGDRTAGVPISAPAFQTVPIRDQTRDLLNAEYQSYTHTNWPAAVEPPAQYYLPPDIFA
jgi:hypothetical protein